MRDAGPGGRSRRARVVEADADRPWLAAA